MPEELNETTENMENSLEDAVSNEFVPDVIIYEKKIDSLGRAYATGKEKMQLLEFGLSPVVAKYQ